MPSRVGLSDLPIQGSAVDRSSRSDGIHMTSPGTNVIFRHLSILLANGEGSVDYIFALDGRNKVQFDPGE